MRLWQVCTALAELTSTFLSSTRYALPHWLQSHVAHAFCLQYSAHGRHSFRHSAASGCGPAWWGSSLLPLGVFLAVPEHHADSKASLQRYQCLLWSLDHSHLCFPPALYCLRLLSREPRWPCHPSRNISSERYHMVAPSVPSWSRTGFP